MMTPRRGTTLVSTRRCLLAMRMRPRKQRQCKKIDGAVFLPILRSHPPPSLALQRKLRGRRVRRMHQRWISDTIVQRWPIHEPRAIFPHDPCVEIGILHQANIGIEAADAGDAFAPHHRRAADQQRHIEQHLTGERTFTAKPLAQHRAPRRPREEFPFVL